MRTMLAAERNRSSHITHDACNPVRACFKCETMCMGRLGRRRGKCRENEPEPISGDERGTSSRNAGESGVGPPLPRVEPARRPNRRLESLASSGAHQRQATGILRRFEEETVWVRARAAPRQRETMTRRGWRPSPAARHPRRAPLDRVPAPNYGVMPVQDSGDQRPHPLSVSRPHDAVRTLCSPSLPSEQQNPFLVDRMFHQLRAR